MPVLNGEFALRTATTNEENDPAVMDRGLVKAKVDEILEKCNKLTEDCFADPQWLGKASQTLENYTSDSQPLTQELIRAKFFVWDSSLFAAVRIRNLPTALDALLKLGSIIDQLPDVDAKQPKPWWNEFISYIRPAFYYRIAVILFLQVKKGRSQTTSKPLSWAALSLSCALRGFSGLNWSQNSIIGALTRLEEAECRKLLRSLSGEIMEKAKDNANTSDAVWKLKEAVLLDRPLSVGSAFSCLDSDQLKMESLHIEHLLDDEFLKSVLPICGRSDFLKRFLWLIDQFWNESIESLELTVDLSNLFPAVEFAPKNLQSVSIESLSLIDIQVFLQLCVHWWHLSVGAGQRSLLGQSSLVWPPHLTEILCSDKQNRAWQSIFLLTRNSGATMDYRLQLQNCLQVLRLTSDREKPHLKLIAAVAKFMDKMTGSYDDIGDKEKALYCSDHAVLFWNSYSVHRPISAVDSLFYISLPAVSKPECDANLVKGRISRAQNFVKYGKYEQALESLKDMTNPLALRLQGDIYRKMAESVVDATQKQALLAKSKDCLLEAKQADSKLNLSADLSFLDETLQTTRFGDTTYAQESIFYTPAARPAPQRQESRGNTSITAISGALMELSQSVDLAMRSNTQEKSEIIHLLKGQLDQSMEHNQKLLENIQIMQREWAEERQRLITNMQQESHAQQQRLVTELSSMFKTQLEVASRRQERLEHQTPPYHTPPYPFFQHGMPAPHGAFWNGYPAPPLVPPVCSYSSPLNMPVLPNAYEPTPIIPRPSAPLSSTDGGHSLSAILTPVTTASPTLTTKTGPAKGSLTTDENVLSPSAITATYFSDVPKSHAEQRRSRGESESSNTEDHFEPSCDFTPLVPLPELVEVTTGEEGEETLFSGRAKLYRFESEKNEFKERGVGEMKILRHGRNKKVRVVMRRDQVHKICANFYIRSDSNLRPLQKSDKAWTWHCQDFADEELTDETLAARFKSIELAQEFKQVFEDCAKTATKAGDTPIKAEKQAAASGFGDQFKEKPGSWTCEGCMVNNGPEIDVCPCCNTGKDGKSAKSFSFKPQSFAAPSTTSVTTPVTFGFGISNAQNEDTSSTTVSQVKSEADKAKDDSKPVAPFGGFSFGQKTATEVRKETPAADPFGGFSFTPKQDNLSDKPANQKPANQSIFGQGLGTGASFSSLASSLAKTAGLANETKTAETSISSTTTTFPGAGTKLFGNVTSPEKAREHRRSRGDSEGSGTDDHFEPNIEFTPLVPLPELVEVQTGEEEEETLFSGRAKLYRFESEKNEFKERGVGEMKILRHGRNKKVRVVMRRDQVHKICANFYIRPDSTLRPLQKSDKAWAWHCQDFADEELTDETLAAKFKTIALAQEFKDVFEDCVKTATKSEDTPIKAEKQAAASGFGDQFKAKPGSWTCEGCMVNNEPEIDVCPCCNTGKDGKTAQSFSFKPQSFDAASTTSDTPVTFGFGISSAQNENTSSTTVSQATIKSEPDQSVSFVQKTQTDKDDSKPAAPFSGFSFGPKPATEVKKETSTSATDPFGGFSFTPKQDNASDKPANQSIFGQGLGTGSSFSSLASTLPKSTGFANGMSPTNSPNTSFPGAGSKLFSSLTSPGTSREHRRSRGDSEGSGTEDHFEPNVEFTPLVPLPELVAVETGEEEEETLFSERAKLFRFDVEKNEFKERGVGEMKILRHARNKKVRVVMRRDQVHKICANFYIRPDSTLRPLQKSDKAWTWHCQDFADEELKDETLAARFKTIELAQEFKQVFEDCAKTATKSGDTPIKAEKQAAASGFDDQFKTKPGSWTCEGCMVNNGPEMDVCPCCNTGKDGKSADSPAISTQLFGASANVIHSTPMTFGFGKPTAKSEDAMKTVKEVSPMNFSFKLNQSDSKTDRNSENVKKFQFPEDFYADKPTCSGCMGCWDDEEADFVFAILNEISHKFEDFDEDPDESEEEEQIIVEMRATLHATPVGSSATTKRLGEAKIEYDDDVDGYRVVFDTDNDENLVNHIICQDYVLNCSTKKSPWFCEWKATDWATGDPVDMEFRLDFSNARSKEDFSNAFNSGIGLAKNNNISNIDAGESVSLTERMPDGYIAAMQAMKENIPNFNEEE